MQSEDCGFKSHLLHQFMKANKERIAHEEKYILFLEKRLNSVNYKNNVSAEELAATQEKLKKSKLILKVLNK